jgi:hypothetical protein
MDPVRAHDIKSSSLDTTYSADVAGAGVGDGSEVKGRAWLKHDGSEVVDANNFRRAMIHDTAVVCGKNVALAT